MADKRREKQSEAITVDDQSSDRTEHELTEDDLGVVDGGDGGQTTYPPYL
jgi:hypothetical protein